MRSPRKQVPIDPLPTAQDDTAATGDKDAFRRRARAVLREILPAKRAERSARIRAALRASGALRPATTVLAFAALPSEPDLVPLIAEFPEVRFAFPKTGREGQLTLHVVADADQLRATACRIREPDPASCPEVSDSAIAVALIPGLAFDPKTLGRLGRGGGFYDRLLARAGFRPRRVGIAFAE